MSTKINIDSMQSYSIYMENRMPSSDMGAYVSDDGALVLCAKRSDFITVTIEFINDSLVKFTALVKIPEKPLMMLVTKNVTRKSIFNGAVIEFLSQGINHFEALGKCHNKSPLTYKDYDVIYKDLNELNPPIPVLEEKNDENRVIISDYEEVG